MTTDLGDPAETGSFLVPAYGFERCAEARAFDADRKTYLGPIDGSEDLYGIIRRDEYCFQPRATERFLLGASALYNPSVGANDRPFFIRLQQAVSEKPRGSRSICLTVEGRRASLRRRDGRSEIVPSYAAWQKPDGSMPLWISRAAYVGQPPEQVYTKTVGAHWSGQGALVAIAPDRRTHLLLVEFRVYDDDPDRPDLLKVWASRHTLATGEIPSKAPAGGPLGVEWRKLIARAEQGYLDECGP